MHPFLTRQTTHTPNFDALYRQQANLDARLLGDSSG
jgi:hypothetical protein